MKKHLLFATLASVLSFAQPSLADWDYIPRDEMVRGADAIAVVTITKIDNCSTTMGRYSRTYHQRATADVKEIVKGRLPAKITIYGSINAAGAPFHCVPDVRLEVGPCLAFLRDESQMGTAYVSANADLGIRPIEQDKIRWCKNNIRDWQPVKLTEVIASINDSLRQKKNEKPEK